jgi:hypothetical protein
MYFFETLQSDLKKKTCKERRETSDLYSWGTQFESRTGYETA